VPFRPHLQKVEELATNLVRNAPVAGLSTDSFRADLAGFLAIAYAAAFEESVKEIFIAFAKSQHTILHRMVEKKFDRINGKIKIDTIKNDYLLPLGEQFKDVFSSELKRVEDEVLRSHGQSVISSFTNIIDWRNAFAHKLERQTTIEEVQTSYVFAKKVIELLNSSLENDPH
jgi:RiboL-PSP-HEPN